MAAATATPISSGAGTEPRPCRAIELMVELLPLLQSHLRSEERRAVRLASRQLLICHDQSIVELCIQASAIPPDADACLRRMRSRGMALPSRLTLTSLHSVQLSRDMARMLQLVGSRATTICLEGNLQVTCPRAVAALAAALPAVQSLEVRLGFRGTCSGYALAALLGSFGARLTLLHFHVEALPQEAESAFALLPACSQLRSLTLHTYDHEVPVGPMLPLDLLCGLPNLTELNLSCKLAMPISSLACLSSLSRLTSLELPTLQPASWDLRERAAAAAAAVQAAQGANPGNPEALMASWNRDPNAFVLFALAELSQIANALQPVLSNIHGLRQLNLHDAELDAGCLQALQRCPLTRLVCQDILGLEALPCNSRALPPTLELLWLSRRQARLATLAELAAREGAAAASHEHGAALQPQPPAVRSATRLDILFFKGDALRIGLMVVPRTETPESDQHVAAEVSDRMRAAAAWLQAHAVSRSLTRAATPEPLSKLVLHAWDRPLLEGQRFSRLAGPHAPWLQALAPLGACITKLSLRDITLAAGDLAALAAALPLLERLQLSHCSWPAHALLELTLLQKLQLLNLHRVQGRSLSSPAASAALQELCARLPLLTMLSLTAYVEGDHGGDEDWGWADAASGDNGPAFYKLVLQHIAESLAMRGLATGDVSMLEVGVDVESDTTHDLNDVDARTYALSLVRHDRADGGM